MYDDSDGYYGLYSGEDDLASADDEIPSRVGLSSFGDRPSPPPSPVRPPRSATPPLPPEQRQSSAEARDDFAQLCETLAARGPPSAAADNPQRPLGFIDKNGVRRKYPAPAPPPLNKIDWTLIMDKLRAWKPKPPEIPALGDPLLFCGPRVDDWKDEETSTIIKETEQLLVSVSISLEDDGSWRSWTAEIEDELAARGTKLADSAVLQFAADPSLRFGVRAFFITFRFFVAVILGGSFKPDETTEFSLEGKRFVAYYFLTMDPETASLEGCI